MAKMKRYFHKIGGRHSEQLKTPKSLLVEGEVVKQPGVSAEFGNHMLETDDEELQTELEKSPIFKSGTVKILKDEPPPREGSGPKYATGKSTVAELDAKKK